MDQMSDEELSLRMRLLYNGRARPPGEDSRLVTLMRNISKLCLAEDETVENLSELYQTIVQDFSLAIADAETNESIFKMYDRTLESLEGNLEEKANQLMMIEQNLTNFRHEVKLLDRLRRISRYPKCQITESMIAETERRKEKLLMTVEDQQKKLEFLAGGCRNLQKVIEGDEPMPLQSEPECITLTDTSEV